jgi:hypothetical protein
LETPPARPRRQRDSKEFRLRVEGKALEEKPQGRYRYETRPDGFGRRKPLGGWETLEGERTGLGKPGWSGLPIPQAPKGEKSHERDIARLPLRFQWRIATLAGIGQGEPGLAPASHRGGIWGFAGNRGKLRGHIGQGRPSGRLSVGEVKPTRGLSRDVLLAAGRLRENLKVRLSSQGRRGNHQPIPGYRNL